MESLSDLLTEARDTLAHDWSGGPRTVEIISVGAGRHCLTTAITGSCDERRQGEKAVELVASLIPDDSDDPNLESFHRVWHWNDAEGRTHGDVMSLMNRAIVLADCIQCGATGEAPDGGPCICRDGDSDSDA